MCEMVVADIFWLF